MSAHSSQPGANSPRPRGRCHLSIAFGDAILPVVDCDDGHDRVPLKPIADEIGINWQTVTRRLEAGRYLHRRLGVKVTPSRGGQKPDICIRIDRVTAFLYSLNPDMVRGKGNAEAADWLEAKHAEWDDALHAYEIHGGAARAGQNGALRDLLGLIKARNAAVNLRERQALEWLLHRELQALGVPADTFENPQQSLPLTGGAA